jgi:hypothetical protein
MTDNLIDLKIKPEFFNTKFLFYNYYQFNKQKKIPINYRTPYCILDGIYLDTIETNINKIIKRKNNNKFIIEFTISENNNIITLLKSINEFNKIFFKNIRLNNNYRKKRTLKNSSSGLLQKMIYSNTLDLDMEYSEVNNPNYSNAIQDINKNTNTNHNREQTRFNNIDSFITKNKYHTYTDFIIKKNDKYIIECEIKPEYCQKLLYKLRTNFNFSNLSNDKINNTHRQELQRRIDLCNDIIKISNSEYFKFNTYEKEWNCYDWNISLNINIKSNIFEINNDDNLEMIWKICSFTL